MGSRDQKELKSFLLQSSFSPTWPVGDIAIRSSPDGSEKRVLESLGASQTKRKAFCLFSFFSFENNHLSLFSFGPWLDWVAIGRARLSGRLQDRDIRSPVLFFLPLSLLIRNASLHPFPVCLSCIRGCIPVTSRLKKM